MKRVFKKNQKGYAILFTLVIVSAVSVITAGLTNTIYKQMILSSLTKDSQAAFYQADTASDCALYADMIEYKKSLSKEPSIFDNTTWSCGGLILTIVPVNGGILNGYDLNPPDEDESSSDPCFRISVNREQVGTKIKSTVTAKGYNICDKTNLRTVERAIEIVYIE
jgi:hypothetical protein